MFSLDSAFMVSNNCSTIAFSFADKKSASETFYEKKP
ncbi:hypothetical protein ZPR_1005 [Zunongwangia profunda SM-A87]|uniref:Uncharacterized protein n=1 Tax=Zunongwangia profunda (strain DSM 18752 / CCTCC AB 206139 / SM-A87) TaxID=655815 RepID=D5BHW2_ZUNPS|nr:hypothetical protein ZPR_1005 [Zunongwangia profunda SM-A87]|tara:strand:+ start:7169 stop:7279 length:111 start_codon:yes stop_codon:yes gene_type:complete